MLAYGADGVDRYFNGLLRRAFALPLLIVLAGCQALLPRATSRTPFGWSSYEGAAAAIERLTPYLTLRPQVHQAGFVPGTNPAITILNYTDLMQRFAASAALPPDELDQGVRDCIKAGKRCTGYLINVRQVRRNRIGNFWLDTLNFRRETETIGWSFNALVVFVDDLVVYVLVGGQPKINEFEVVRNPLGPLQGLGEALRPTIR